MWPQAKENLEPPEGRRKAPSLRALWPYNTSISDLWSPKLGEKLFLLFKTPRLQQFVTATAGNEYTVFQFLPAPLPLPSPMPCPTIKPIAPPSRLPSWSVQPFPQLRIKEGALVTLPVKATSNFIQVSFMLVFLLDWRSLLLICPLSTSLAASEPSPAPSSPHLLGCFPEVSGLPGHGQRWESGIINEKVRGERM